jgi:hypothetical protein
VRAKTKKARSCLLSSTAAMMKSIHRFHENVEKHFLSPRQNLASETLTMTHDPKKSGKND